MAVSKQKKGEVLEKLGGALKGANSVVFVKFHGLSVADTRTLRSKLREEGVGYTVAKKTLIRKALNDVSASGEVPELPGELALAYGSDPIAPARGVYEFQKKFKDAVSIMGGIFENSFRNKEEMLSIATIPPLQVLHGQFVNLINSPIQGLVIALNSIAEKKS